MNQRVQAILALVFAVGAGSCTTTYLVDVPPAADPAPVDEFEAGFARTDITPPPGVPTFGYSLTGRVGQGYRHRLQCRAAYLASPGGERWAMVVVDLGAVSMLLHHRVVAQLPPELGITVDRLTLAATHTHAGPGATFGCEYFNHFGATTFGFDEALIDSLSGSIAAAVVQAACHKVPARLGVRADSIFGLTHNRSLPAHLANPEVANLPEPERAAASINPTATVIRVNRKCGQPLGAIAIFAIHGTVLGPNVDLFHGDVHGAAMRTWEELEATPGFVALLANGDEGDVRPNAVTTDERTFAGARRLGHDLADRLHGIFAQTDTFSLVPLAVRTRELDLDAAAEGPSPRPCERASVGAPVIGGSEEGGLPGEEFKEGTRRASPQCCQTWKKEALAPLQGIFLGEDSFPRRTLIQTIRVGELVLCALPGEMTVVMGRRLRTRCAESLGKAGAGLQFAIIGLANDFVSYFATPEEYDVQHYEGASTLYGRESGPYLAHEVGMLAQTLSQSAPPARQGPWEFPVGLKARFFPEQLESTGKPPSFTKIDVQVGRTVVAEFVTEGPAPHLIRNPWIRVIRKDGSFPSADDTGLDFEVRRKSWNPEAGHSVWQATWFVPLSAPPGLYELQLMSPAFLVQAFAPFTIQKGFP